jgi:sulfofructose kinase
VVGLGLCVVDHLYVVDALGESPERSVYRDRILSSGGMIGNAVMQSAALGVETDVVSVVGDDEGGRLIRRALRRAGVRTRHLVLERGRATRVAVVLVDRDTGERRFVIADRSVHERGVASFDLDAIREGSVLLIDGHFSAQARRAARHARRVGARVVADFNLPRPELLALLPWVDHPVVPLEFAQHFAAGDPERTLRALRERCVGTPVVTAGAQGGFYLDSGCVRRFRSPKVTVRDTTGAGDAFHGAFAAELAAGHSFEKALDTAARAGARACRSIGATGHLMPPDERVRGARRLSARRHPQG